MGYNRVTVLSNPVPKGLTQNELRNLKPGTFIRVINSNSDIIRIVTNEGGVVCLEDGSFVKLTSLGDGAYELFPYTSFKIDIDK